MSAITFDTLKFANKLKAAGVPPAQAEAEAEVQAEAHAAQADSLAQVLAEQRAQLQAQIDAQRKTLEDAAKRDFSDAQLRSENALTRLEAKVDKGFADARGETDRQFAKVDKQFAEIKGEMSKVSAEHKGEMQLLRWMLGILVAGVATLIVKSFF